jgi:hypothetical protein
MTSPTTRPPCALKALMAAVNWLFSLVKLPFSGFRMAVIFTSG